MTSSTGLVSALDSSQAVAAIAALFIVVLIIVIVVIVFGRLSWRSRGRGSKPPVVTDIQRAAEADVAELRENDHYDPEGPGLQEEEDL
jgi:hypothetical protein